MTAPLRILLASDHYPPSVGGAQRQTQMLAHRLAARGHVVEVVTPSQGSSAPRDEADEGVRVRRLQQLRTALDIHGEKPARHQPPFPDPVTIFQLRRIVSRFRPEIVHSYGWFTNSVMIALAGHRVPLVVSARDYSCSCPKQTMLFHNDVCDGPSVLKCIACCSDRFGKLKGVVTASSIRSTAGVLRKRIDGLHCISAYVEQTMRRDFLLADGAGEAVPTVVIPSFGDYPAPGRALDPAPTARERELHEAPFMLFVGALRREKGIDELLAAYQRVEHAPRLLLVGTVGDDRPAHVPQGVCVVGEVAHSVVMDLWERCLFGVIPSLFAEPLGSVVHEGMSRGKAVIGTRPGGHADMIVDGETGILVPAGDVAALSRAMQQLVDDDALRNRLGDAARVRAAQFSADVVIPQFEEFYHRVIGARAAR
jgi:glycosyltransferase involved in cell wall biosynthesis